MGNSATYELAILLSLRDAASGRLDRFQDKLRATGKEGRAMLRDFQDLRQSVGRDLTIGGIGIAGLAVLKRGVETAGDFQASITDLRTAITRLGTDGQVNVSLLNNQMSKLEALSMRLGNALPGTTEDFVQGFIAAKQGGLEATEIIDGAGEAVSHLAVVMKTLPKDVGTPFAKFGMQFGLRGREFVDLADMMARARAATGADPMDLIMSTKYFAPRAAQPLGITGAKGAQETVQLLALLNRKGISGEQAGTNLSTFFSRLTMDTKQQQSVLKELRKGGIDLQFFDKQGKFSGVENVFAQLEKLRNLKDEDRLSVMKQLFESEGAGVGNVFSQAGVEGYRQMNTELLRMLPLQAQINAQTATYNAKIESLQGTLSNLKVTAFEPLLDPLSKLADYANTGVGGLQGFAKSNPALTSTAAHTLAIGSAALTAYAGIRTLTTAWRLMSAASMVTKGEGGLLGFLARTRTEAASTVTAIESAASRTTVAKTVISRSPIVSSQPTLPFLYDPRSKGPVQGVLPIMYQTQQATKATAIALDDATKKAGRFRSALTGIPPRISTAVSFAGDKVASGVSRAKNLIGSIPTELKIGFTLMALDFTTQKVIELMNASSDLDTSRKGLEAGSAMSSKAFERERQMYASRGEQVPSDRYREQARSMLDSLNSGANRELEFALDPSRQSWWQRLMTHGMNPYTNVRPEFRKKVINGKEMEQLTGPSTPEQRIANAADIVRRRAPDLKEPEVMSQMRGMIDSWKLPAESRKNFDQILEQAFPQSFREATGQTAEGMMKLSPETAKLAEAFTKLGDPLNNLPTALGRANTSLNSFASRVSLIDITAPTTTVPSTVTPKPPFNFNFGQTSKSGYRSEEPRQVSQQAARAFASPASVRGQTASQGAGQTARGDKHYRIDKIVLQPPPGSLAANDPRAFMEMLEHHLDVIGERV